MPASERNGILVAVEGIDGAGKTTQVRRMEALLRNRLFTMEYANARERWRDGAGAVFPSGTYWLRRFASVPVLET